MGESKVRRLSRTLGGAARRNGGIRGSISEAISEKHKLNFPSLSDKGGGGKQKGSRPRNPWAFERLEADIVKLEGERDELLAAMQQEENYTDAARMTDLQYRHAEVERELDEKNETWANWE